MTDHTTAEGVDLDEAIEAADDAAREAIFGALNALGFDTGADEPGWERVIATLAHEAVRAAAPIIAAPAERKRAATVDALKIAIAMQADLRTRLATAERDALLRAADAFTEHYLSNVECDHERGMDRPWCACSLVDLGWHPSVGDAVKAWRDHVMSVLRERAKAVGNQPIPPSDTVTP